MGHFPVFKLEATCVSSHTEELWYTETVGLYIYIYIWGGIVKILKKERIKAQSIQRMILFIVELFAYVERFGFYIKPSLGHIK